MNEGMDNGGRESSRGREGFSETSTKRKGPWRQYGSPAFSWDRDLSSAVTQAPLLPALQALNVQSLPRLANKDTRPGCPARDRASCLASRLALPPRAAGKCLHTAF